MPVQRHIIDDPWLVIDGRLHDYLRIAGMVAVEMMPWPPIAFAPFFRPEGLTRLWVIAPTPMFFGLSRSGECAA